jgi:hypothetical protein
MLARSIIKYGIFDKKPDIRISNQFGIWPFIMVEIYVLRPLVLLAGLIASSQAKDIYVSPTGTGSGTSTSPYGSIQSAVNAAVAGDTILLRAGTYKPTTNIQITKSGTRTAPITLRSYQKEKVILDGESLPGYVLVLIVFMLRSNFCYQDSLRPRRIAA